MKSFFQWSEPIERLPFILTSCIALLCIFLLPSNFNALLMSFTGGSAEMSAPRMIGRAIGLPIGLFIIMIPLLFVTRRRLRDLDLSGVLLFVFPVWPLMAMASGPIMAVTMFPSGGAQPLLWTGEFWLGISCLLLLMLAHGKTAGGPPRNLLFQKLQRATDCSVRIGAAAFRKRAFSYLLLLALLSLAPMAIAKIAGVFLPKSIYFLLSLSLSAARMGITLALVSLTARRLNDLGKSVLWTALFPLLFFSIFSSFLTKLMFALVTAKWGHLFLFFPRFGIFQILLMGGFIASIGLFAWLMRASSSLPTSATPAPEETLLYEIAAPAAAPIRFRPVPTAVLAGVLVVMGALAFYQTTHPYKYLRYRMTVAVETPEGTKTGSAIRQVNFDSGPKGYPWIVGEAVPVDLGSRGMLFALIGQSETVPDYGYTVIYDTFPMPDRGAARTQKGLDYYSKLEAGPTPVAKYPKFIRFDNIDDPQTVHAVDPDNLADAFGEGVRLREVTIEMTQDAPVASIAKTLRWVDAPVGFYLPGGFASRRSTGGLVHRARENSLKNFSERLSATPYNHFNADAIARDARGGDASAQHELALNYDSNPLFPRDPAEAMKWYRRAADQGYGPAKQIVNLPVLEAEIATLRKSAEAAAPAAQSDLCLMYATGRGVAKDYSQAFKWCKQAAEQGDARGASGTGAFYMSGLGTDELPSEGIKWLKSAAEKGDAVAQLNLGYAYAAGFGAEPARKASQTWYQKAKDNGFCPRDSKGCSRYQPRRGGEGNKDDRFRVVVAGPPVTIEDIKIRNDLWVALNDPAAEIGAFKSFRKYLMDLPARGAEEADVSLISMAIADPRVTDFNGLGSAIGTMGQAAQPLVKLMIDRTRNATLPADREVLQNLNWAFARVPDGLMKDYGADLRQLVLTPDYRGLSWHAVSRIADQGPEALTVFLEILRMPHESFKVSRVADDRFLQLGAIVGLCRMGTDAAGSKDMLIQFVHAEKQTTRPRFIEPAIETLSNLMDAETLKAEFRGEIEPREIDRYIKRSTQRKCAGKE